MKLGIKYQIWLFVLVPTISLSMLLGTYFTKTHFGIFFLLYLCIGTLYAFQIGRNITRPILALAEGIDKIKSGALNTRVKITAYRELEILESGINTMAQTLEFAHTELQNKVEQATLSLRRTLETIEVQNVELEIARRTAEKANKIKSEFLADMSHEIRTPLNGVVGFANLMQKTELNTKQQEYISIIQKSANNLLAIINDILDFSKIEAGKLRMEHTPMDVRDCITETFNLLAPRAQEKNIALIPMVYSDVPNHFLGDPLRVKQIITNLVNNAIKFTEQGSVTVRVILEHETYSHTTLRISVSDTGIGIGLENQKSLFQAFNQMRTDTTRKFGGTGLGLVICKKLVEQMGGDIHVESEYGKGATFWFTLPVEKYIEPTHPELALSTDIVEIKNFNTPLNVLAVDDTPENLKLITLLLEDMNMNVTAVKSGEAAIEAVEGHLFHLILMDIRMPTMNGIEATRTIREFEKIHNRDSVPIIALTAHALISEKQALLSAGIDDYLVKPIVENELKRILNKWIKVELPQKSIDWELGKKLAGGRAELAKEFLEKLIQSLPKSKIELNEDYQNEAWEALRNHIHKLHGACCYCGVPKLKRHAEQLENIVASRTLDLIKPHLDALNSEIDAVLAEVNGVTTY